MLNASWARLCGHGFRLAVLASATWAGGAFAAAGPVDGGTWAVDGGVLLVQQASGADGGTAVEDGGTEVTPEEMEAIQRSLSSDAPARGSNATPPAPPPQTPAPRGFSLQSLNPDLSFIADVAAAWFSKGEPFQTGGHDPTERGFNLQALEMAVSKAVDPFFRFDANFAFSQEGVEIEEAYATSLSFPFRTQLRVGQFLTRFGRINNTHPHTWAFVDQPFAIGRVFGGDGNRGLGAELSWLTPLPWYVELVGSVTDARGENTARSFFGAEPLPLRSPLDLQITGALKQFFAVSDDLSLLWGLSTAAGPNSTGGERNRTDVYGTDLYLKFRPISDPSNPTIVSLQVEALYRRRQIPDALLRDLNGYAEIFWRFEPRWGIASRYEMGTGDDLFREPAVEDPLDPDWGRLRQRVSANVTFWPTEFSRVRLQGASSVIDTAARPEYSLFLAFEFAVGAHGAHVF